MLYHKTNRLYSYFFEYLNSIFYNSKSKIYKDETTPQNHQTTKTNPNTLHYKFTIQNHKSQFQI